MLHVSKWHPTRPPPPPLSHCRRRLPLHNIMTVLTSCYTRHIFSPPFSSATPPSPTIPPTNSHLPNLLPMGTLPGQCNKEQEDGDTGWRLRGQSATCRHNHTFLKVGQKHHRAADRRCPHDIPTLYSTTKKSLPTSLPSPNSSPPHCKNKHMLIFRGPRAEVCSYYISQSGVDLTCV